MKKSRYTEEHIIGILKRTAQPALYFNKIHKYPQVCSQSRSIESRLKGSNLVIGNEKWAWRL